MKLGLIDLDRFGLEHKNESFYKVEYITTFPHFSIQYFYIDFLN